MLGFGRVRQASRISLSVFLCEFLFALLLLCRNGGICESYYGFGWTSTEKPDVEMGNVGSRWCCCDEGVEGL